MRFTNPFVVVRVRVPLKSSIPIGLGITVGIAESKLPGTANEPGVINFQTAALAVASMQINIFAEVVLSHSEPGA